MGRSSTTMLTHTTETSAIVWNISSLAWSRRHDTCMTLCIRSLLTRNQLLSCTVIQAAWATHIISARMRGLNTTLNSRNWLWIIRSKAVLTASRSRTPFETCSRLKMWQCLLLRVTWFRLCKSQIRPQSLTWLSYSQSLLTRVDLTIWQLSLLKSSW